MNKRGQEYVITMIVVLALMTLILGLYMGWIDTSIPVINSLIGKENLDLRVQECNNACNSIPPQSYAYCQKTRKLTLPDKKKTEGTCYEFSKGENIPAEYKSYFQSCEKINCEEFLGGEEAEGEEDEWEDENLEEVGSKSCNSQADCVSNEVCDLCLTNSVCKTIPSFDNNRKYALRSECKDKESKITGCDYPLVKTIYDPSAQYSFLEINTQNKDKIYFLDSGSKKLCFWTYQVKAVS